MTSDTLVNERRNLLNSRLDTPMVMGVEVHRSKITLQGFKHFLCFVHLALKFIESFDHGYFPMCDKGHYHMYKRRLPPPEKVMHGLTLTVRRHTYRSPDVSWLCGRRKLPIIRHSRVVRLLATTWANLLVNTTFVSGAFTRFLRRCHVDILG